MRERDSPDPYRRGHGVYGHCQRFPGLHPQQHGLPVPLGEEERQPVQHGFPAPGRDIRQLKVVTSVAERRQVDRRVIRHKATYSFD